MGINGIGADYYQAGYSNNKATKAETGSNGFSITSDGKHFHIPELLVQHAIRWYNGEIEPDKMQKLITMNTQLIGDSLELRNCALKYNLGHSAIILLSCNAVKTFGIDIRNLI